ncbi:hypothetical protein BV22DRAFT_831909 [Leucogyrophana mollusca]|uniref:Uncharacterized protein n=1 Tax=Leucogyrophana mollusca TaxID=85980 RepID=A0ACB8B379_9AGAM|nr:hypothetical protein BV22DRAFT_831909 [Leucogyrophana mollusca]
MSSPRCYITETYTSRRRNPMHMALTFPSPIFTHPAALSIDVHIVIPTASIIIPLTAHSWARTSLRNDPFNARIIECHSTLDASGGNGRQQAAGSFKQRRKKNSSKAI